MTSSKDRDVWKRFLEGVTPLSDSGHPEDLFIEKEPLSKEVNPPGQSFDRKKDKQVSKRQSIVRETAPQKKPGVFASIDLHGFTQEKARQHLLLGLRRLQENRSKCVLVITGKGTRGLIETGVSGRLRLALTQWVSQEDFKEIVREIAPAKQAHGGQGAFYVWVRAKK